MDGLPLVLVVALGLGFAYTNGFHDAANAIATSVSSRVLTPAIAVGMASTANFLGAFFGEKVARTIGTDLIGTPTGTTAVTVVAAALLAAVAWNLFTWWRGMPSSSTHALVGGLCGASVVAGVSVNWDGVLGKVVTLCRNTPLLLSARKTYTPGVRSETLNFLLLVPDGNSASSFSDTVFPGKAMILKFNVARSVLVK